MGPAQTVVVVVVLAAGWLFGRLNWYEPKLDADPRSSRVPGIGNFMAGVVVVTVVVAAVGLGNDKISTDRCFGLSLSMLSSPAASLLGLAARLYTASSSSNRSAIVVS